MLESATVLHHSAAAPWPPRWEDHPEWGWDDAGYEELVRKLKVILDSRELIQKTTNREALAKYQEHVRDVRAGAKRNLYFLVRDILEFADGNVNLLNKRTHVPICQFFVHKDDTKTIGGQDRTKERLLLYPRGAFKSSIDCADTIQWILNFPDIRILLLSATRELTQAFMDELKGKFVVREGNPSIMNILFPDFCVPENDLGKSTVFNCPLRKSMQRREPTVMASSVESALSGFHFDVIKCDDIVSNDNSGNEDILKKNTKNLAINKKMLMSFGYLDLIGTRYDEMDTYGEYIEKNVDGSLKVLCEPAWKIKAASKDKREDELGKEDYDLLFPELLSYEFLMREKHRDEISFEGQLNMNPRPKVTTVFDRELLEKHTVGFRMLPLNGPISITWDFAFSKRRGRDYTAGVVGRYNDKGQLFIIDLIFGRFKPAELAYQVAKLANAWNPYIVGIEDAGGSRYLEGSIIFESQKLGMAGLKIDWFPVDSTKDAKKTRIAALHPWMMRDMLFFSAHLPHLETLYKQFELCMGSHHHEDIPDAVAHQLRYAPRIQNLIEKNEIATWSREDAAWNLMFEENCDAFGRIGMGYTVPITPEPGESAFIRPETPSPELAPILGSGLNG